MEDICGRIWVDLNNADEKGRIRLVTTGAIEDIDTQHIELSEGKCVIIHQDNDEFELLARIEYSPEEKIWVANPDWSTKRKI